MAKKMNNLNSAMLSVSLWDMFMNAVRFFAYGFFYGYYFARGTEERKALA